MSRGGQRLLALLVATALSVTLAASTSSAGRQVSIVRERPVSAAPTSLATRSREPIVAAHPTDPTRIAVAYPRGDRSPGNVIAISHDRGTTFVTAPGDPVGGGNHPAIAWGRGPRAGSARLYYMGMTTSLGRCCVFAISWSDNEGRTWSSPWIARGTTPWFGGYPELATDTNPRSPNLGTVYAAYNWPANPTKGPGLRLLASSDYGRTFHGIEVPVARPPLGYGDTWRVDYRIRAAADGSAYIAFYQRDVRTWVMTNPFASGGMANVGRIGFSVARFVHHRASGTFSLGPTVMAARLPETAWNLGSGSSVTGLTDPMWCFGLDVDPVTGAVYLAVAADGRIRVYRSNDRGATWRYRTLPAAAAVAGRSQAAFRPNVVAGPGFVVVTLHTIDRSGGSRTVGNDVSTTFDGGLTWTRPAPIGASRWRTDDIGSTYNGVGLRERAVLTADGAHVFFAYGDGRMARSGRFGFSRIYGALLSVSAATAPPTPSPSATPTPSPTPSPPDDPPPLPD